MHNLIKDSNDAHEVTKKRLRKLYVTHREYFYHSESNTRTNMLETTKQEIELLRKELKMFTEDSRYLYRLKN